MPGWHEKTRKLRNEGKLDLVGIIQEQHPDRCRLFMAWKRMDFPILVDSLNLLGVSAVPIAVLVDEAGVIRGLNPKVEEVEEFAEKSEPGAVAAPAPSIPGLAALEEKARANGTSAMAWLDLGDALFLQGSEASLDRSIEAYRKSVALDGPPEGYFRLGVALRRRFEIPARKGGDLQAAIDAWTRALAARPDQYIWRRRLQQYGPRLEKPYAFYDWVKEARAEISARGEKPPELLQEPRGAEIAHPVKEFRKDSSGESDGALQGPDPEGKVPRDRGNLVRIETAVAPAPVARGKTARAFLVLRPEGLEPAHWNNESEPLIVWLSPPEGLDLDGLRHSIPNPREPSTDEARQVEFELRVKPDEAASSLHLPGYALYSICEEKTGICKLVRQDFTLTIAVKD